MTEKYLKSPINYSGSKYRLLNQLIPMFPEEIETFVDLFSGACNVGVNVKAAKVICNDIINYIPELYEVWKNKSLDEINKYIDETIEKNDLSSANKEEFLKFRTKYNETKNIEDLFILNCYAFNNQMRFNNKKQYNSSFGYEASTMNPNIRNNVNLFVSKIQERNIIFQSKDFRDVELDNLSSKDLVYVDPPYSVSRAVYQDGKRGFKGWGSQDDIELCQLLDRLNDQGIRFAMSNMTESKGNINEYLIEWAKKYNIYDMTISYSNASYHRKSKGTDKEVLITNYEVIGVE